MIVVEIHQTEEEFARLEGILKEIRYWLNAGPQTRDGRGDRYTATMYVAGMTLQLHVKRDEVQDDDGS